MALNLAAHLQTLSPPLPPLIVYNRTTSKTDNVVSESKGGCRAAKSPAELAQSCDLIFTSLSNDAAAHEVYAQLLEGEERRVGKERAERTSASSPTIFVDTSTLYPETTGERALKRVAGTDVLTDAVILILYCRRNRAPRLCSAEALLPKCSRLWTSAHGQGGQTRVCGGRPAPEQEIRGAIP